MGRHVVEAELGRGGMGVVYLARDVQLDRPVALKALPPDMSADPEARRRLEREARLLAALEHPHVAAIYGLEEADGHTYLVLQHVDGETLARRLVKGPLPIREALRVGSEIASGLSAAHRHGIVHCDLKPGNVMLTRDGSVKLVDFGIARRWSRSAAEREGRERPAEIMGTPGYMSPEQVRGEPVDPATDAWAFGCVLLECLTGRSAFGGVDSEERAFAVLDQGPDMTGLPSGVPPAVTALLDRCFQRDPRLRLSELSEARDELRVAATTGARSLPAFPTNLPAALTTFVGREAEMEAVTALVRSARLVTLTGAAGCGKTRLAVEAARRMAESFPDGTWMAPLAPLASGDRVEPAVAAAFGLRAQPGIPLRDTLVAALRGRSTLLVLDNCEHVLEPVADLADALLRECPSLHVACTSREALGVGGEVAWRVPSLGHGPAARGATAADVGGHDAVRLFVERAREARRDFALDDENAHAVASIVQRLDGIPLALELAAARVKVLSVEQILERLSDRFRLLTGGSRTALERHQTLKAAIDWSHDLLDERERRCLRELSVFAGGFRLEEAARTCTGDEFEVLDLVSHLVDKSLLQVEASSSKVPRYRLLESVRQHAAGKLDDSGEAAAVRTRHRDAYLALAEAVDARVRVREDEGWLTALEAENDNMRAALEWSLSDPDGGLPALRHAAALVRFWDLRAYWKEAAEWIDRAMAHAPPDAPAALWGAVLDGRARTDWWLGDYSQAVERARASSEAHERGGDPERAAAVLLIEHMSSNARGDLREALAGYRDVEARLRRIGARISLADALLNIAVVSRDMADLEAADAAATEALAIAERLRDGRRQGNALKSLGAVARDRGQHERARELLERATRLHEVRAETHYARSTRLELAHVLRMMELLPEALELYLAVERGGRDAGQPRVSIIAGANVGVLLTLLGRHREAEAKLRAVLGEAIAIGATALVAGILSELAWVLAIEGDAAPAVTGMAAAAAARERAGRKLSGTESAEEAERLAALRARLGDAAFEAAWTAGRARDVTDLARAVLAG